MVLNQTCSIARWKWFPPCVKEMYTFNLFLKKELSLRMFSTGNDEVNLLAVGRFSMKPALKGRHKWE